MKLPDFTEDAELNRLRQQMNAPRREWNQQSDWRRIDLDAILRHTGMEVNPADIIVTSDRTLEYEGFKVAVFIRDQPINTDYRFHVADCRTLIQMRRDGRYEKFVVATRQDGIFLVNQTSSGVVVNEEVEMRLHVCQNCLESLRWQNYEYGMRDIWLNFNLEDFFEVYNSTITQRPRYTDQTAPENTYAADWDRISKRYKVSVGWTCEACNIDLSESRTQQFLQTHHINGLRNDNQPENLKALCLECHANQPAHNHVTYSPSYRRFQDYRRGI